MASIVQGYEYDIFISYRQKDNKYDSWVTEFVDNLKKELEATFKEEISVYFDSNLHDGLLETHDVNASLKEKLRCLVFIPIISRTYCDPKSFAWEHELKAFVDLASQDHFGLKVKLSNGNVANRILPIRIHDLDITDVKLCESQIGSVLRGVDFIYKSAGVNRPLRSKEENPHDNLNHTNYRDQINKVSLAIKDIIESLKVPTAPVQMQDNAFEVKKNRSKEELLSDDAIREESSRSKREMIAGESKQVNQKIIFRSILVISIVSIVLILSLFGYKFYERQNARNTIIPEIQKLVENSFIAPSHAFELAIEAEKYIPNDSMLKGLWTEVGTTNSLNTLPEGANVFWKDYDNLKDSWKAIGVTPLQNYRIPVSYIRLKIEKAGFQTVLLTSHGFYWPEPDTVLKLDSIGVLPENMVRIPSLIAGMNINGLKAYAGKQVGEFLSDRFEVTNKEYKRFIDSGGYSNKIYWNYPIYLEGKEMSGEQAMKIFVDKTGKQGPAGWVVGRYPDGEDYHPVSGISWYEASAYAAFAGKILPTIYHWSVIAETFRSMNIIPLSNFNGKSTVLVGSMEGISSYGLYDLAGNVREWCYNLNGINGESYILGGGWNDPTCSFNDAGIQPSIDRSLSNGFRCIKLLPGDTTFTSLSVPIKRDFRDYRKEKPADDKIFSILLRQYDYDKLPLNTQVFSMEETGIWKVEKVTIDAGYNKEKLNVYLFIPKDVQPPYQTVLCFPGANMIYTPVFEISDMNMYDFIVKYQLWNK